MNNKWKWRVGITLALIFLSVPLFARLFFIPNAGYRMMGYGSHMPMMYGAPGMMSFGMMLLMWLVLLAFLVLMVLGIAWLVKTLTATK